MKKIKKAICLLLAVVLMASCVGVFSALASDTLLVQYTFNDGLPQDFEAKSYDGAVRKPKVVRDSERGRVLRQYFGAGTGYGNGDPAGESYVDIAANPYCGKNTANGVTFMLWVKTADDAPWDYNDTILSFNSADTRFALNNCPYLDYHINGADVTCDVTADTQQSIKGKWRHFAFTVSPEGIRIFADGAEVPARVTGNSTDYAQILAFLSSADTSLNLGLGGYFGSQDCYMDDIRFYTGIVSDEDIFEIYDSTVDFTTRNTKTVSHAGVHDPSITTCYILSDGAQVGENDPRAAQAVDKRWWIFGSHMAVGYSDDLINWHNYASGFDENNPLINYTNEQGDPVKFTDMFTYDLGYHGDITGMWAGCPLWLPEKNQWALYGSCTSVLPDYGYNSVLWVMYADKIEGPYKDPQPMVFTNPSFNVSNSQAYIASVCPDGATYTDKSWWSNTVRTTHTVDPTAFWDKDGKLWMIYGSYNSLFILPMDESTGLPDYEESYQRELVATNAGKNDYSNNDWKSDWYWGTRINYTNFATDWTGEGTFIYYDTVTNYYYLYITYGGFASLGGYNMRVLRSRTPEGPYIDAQGQDLLSVLDSDPVPVNAGVKMTANYQWHCNSVGYLSPGHDSVLCETVDGVEKIFQMYHVRFNNRSEGFFDQLHQMVRTKDGWTLMLPYEYYGETVDYSHEYPASEIAGAYEFIDLKTTTYHITDESDYDCGSDIVLPTQRVVLSADGKIYGVASYKGGTKTDFENAHVIEKTGIIGTWREDSGSCYADFTIDGTVYTGLFTYQYDESKTREKTLVFVASGDNRTIWGSKISAGSFRNSADQNGTLEQQVTFDGTATESSLHLYGNAATVSDFDRGTVLFLPEGDEGYATLDNPFYGKDLSEGATISFWARVSEQADFDAANIFLSFLSHPDEWRYFTVNAAPQAHIFNQGYADYYAENVPAYTPNKWHQFALTVDESERVAFYIDGVKVGCTESRSDGYSDSILTYLAQTETLYLGKTQRPNGADWQWTGQECCMDNLCFYSSALTPLRLLDNLMASSDVLPATTAPESIGDITVDPVVYTHGTGSSGNHLYAGNIISHGKGLDYRRTYLHIPDDFELLALESDNGSVQAVKGAQDYYLTGTVRRTDTDMALTLYLRADDCILRKTVYTYVKNNPADAHVAEWNCVNTSSKKRSLCHLSRLRGSEGSGGSGDFAYLENPTDFSCTGNSAEEMGFTGDYGKNAGAYAYAYSSVGIINQSIKNDTVPRAVYYIDKSAPKQEFWDGSQYKFTWRFTTLNANSSALWSTGRSVWGESDNAAVTVDVSAGAYDESPNSGGNVRDYFVTGSVPVQNNTVTVSMTQGSSPKASVNHRLSLTVNLYDKSAVRNALKAYETLYESAYSANSWSAFESARRSAWRYLNDYEITDDSAATQQAYITALDTAAAALETVDYSSLEELIAQAKALSPDSFTDRSYAAVMKYTGICEALLGCADSQAQVYAYGAKLNACLNKLVPAFLLSGTVTDTLGNPIENVALRGDGVSVTTAADGTYRAKLQSGSFTLTLTAPTAVSREVTFTVTDSAVPSANVVLVNCDMNRDGYINGRDWAHAATQQNPRAKAEIKHMIEAYGGAVDYERM